MIGLDQSTFFISRRLLSPELKTKSNSRTEWYIAHSPTKPRKKSKKTNKMEIEGAMVSSLPTFWFVWHLRHQSLEVETLGSLYFFLRLIPSVCVYHENTINEICTTTSRRDDLELTNQIFVKCNQTGMYYHSLNNSFFFAQRGTHQAQALSFDIIFWWTWTKTRFLGCKWINSGAFRSTAGESGSPVPMSQRFGHESDPAE